MVEVECPLCESDIEVPDVEGHYECPECEGTFEYEGVESDSPIVSLREIWPVVVFFILFITGSALIIIFGETCTVEDNWCN